jgi:Beta-ketoacyl synthase, N-terminal domain
MSGLPPIGVRTVACWTADNGAPTASLLPAAQRRRCSLLTRMVAEVTGNVVAELASGALEIGDTAWVCGTAFGEIATTVELLAMMQQDDGALSPMRFAGSVHNTALGQLAIATGHRGGSTTVSAGEHTVAMAMLEAAAMLACGTEHVVVVLADEPLPAPLRPAHDGLAVALWLTRSLEGARASLHGLGTRRAPSPPRVPAPLLHNPCAAAWALAEAIESGLAQTVRLQPEDARGQAICVDVLAGAR